MSKAKAPPSISSHAAQGQIKQGKNSLALGQLDTAFQLLRLRLSLSCEVIKILLASAWEEKVA